MEYKREVKITSGCPNKRSWGKYGIVLSEHRLNNKIFLLVDIKGNWLLVDEMFVDNVG